MGEDYTDGSVKTIVEVSYKTTLVGCEKLSLVMFIFRGRAMGFMAWYDHCMGYGPS